MMSFTLLTFTNSFPDMVTSILMAKDKEEGPLFCIAGLFATFIFQTTVTIAFVIFNSGEEVQVNKKFFFKEIISTCVIIISFLGFGLLGWISGTIIFIFTAFYVCYVIASYLLAKDDKRLPPMAILDISENEGTVDNLDLEGYAIKPPQSEKGFGSFTKDGQYKVNVISIERNSFTPSHYLKR